ncbi:MAG: NnrS family protein, partial [Psychrobium sp.]
MAVLQPQDPRLANDKPQHQGLDKVLNHDFLSLAFRPFFLLAAGASALSLMMWIGFFLGYTFQDDVFMTPTVWHVHEMIFGFAATVAVGFVLTAVQTWTKLPSLSKGWVLALVVMWLAVRVGLYVNSQASLTIAIVVQLIWWMIVIGGFSRLLFKSENKRN